MLFHFVNDKSKSIIQIFNALIVLKKRLHIVFFEDEIN